MIELSRQPSKFVAEATLSEHTRWVASVAFSSDGKQAASCSDDGTLATWDVSMAKLKRK